MTNKKIIKSNSWFLRVIPVLLVICGICLGLVNAEEKADAASPIKSGVVLEGVVSSYLKVKNALTIDNAKEAGKAGFALLEELKKLDISQLSADQRKVYNEISEDAKEHAEHIGENSKKIDHQREHLAMLSKDILDLIDIFGSPQKLYQAFCPMYDKGQGALWLSENKEIKNPYYGKKMSTCGSVKKEL